MSINFTKYFETAFFYKLDPRVKLLSLTVLSFVVFRETSMISIFIFLLLLFLFMLVFSV